MSFSDHHSGPANADRRSMDEALSDHSGVRRRPPTAPYIASNAYGTYEGDSLLRYAPYADSPEDPQYFARRRAPVPWYKQPQKIVMVATLAWIGGVMYLANLAHAILRSHKQSHQVMGSPIMGSSNTNSKNQVNVRFGMENYDDKDADYKQWLQDQKGYGMENYADKDADYQQWLQNKNAYGMESNPEEDADFQEWLDTVKNGGYGKKRGLNNDANYQEWLQYQHNNKVRYEANGKYGKAQPVPEMLQSDASGAQEVAVPEALLDSSVSTIDWPSKMGLASPSCTVLNGCSPSNNVTILVVYGPEYHTHISEMAWNVATGVHTALKSHIKHHPNSPIHGHIIYGHTSNITFLDVKDADAIIIGSPVYNGNVHPDVQNWINYWHIDADLSNKFGGAFVTAGGIHAGADGTIMSILRSMMVFQMMAVGGDSWTSPFGAVATMYEDPFGDVQRTDAFNESCYFTDKQGRSGEHLVHPYFLRKAFGLGERITNVTVAWKNSSYIRW